MINGDEHDLRFLDKKGVIVGLSPKGDKAKRAATTAQCGGFIEPVAKLIQLGVAA